MPARKKPMSTDPRSWSREDKLRLLQQFEAEEAAERARELEALGWRGWYTAMFGEEFVSNLADHHIEAIEWHWMATVARRAGMAIDKSTYPAIWPRGHRKSDVIRHIVVADACLMPDSYCLYVSGTKNKVRGHAISVESLIGCEGVQRYYPTLAKVKRNLQGSQKSWSADLLYSENGSVFHFVGLSEGVAGANIDNVRPSLIVGDDIDDREDSPMISEGRLKVFTRSVLPTRQRTTLVFIAQNYISRHGVIYRIHTGKERVLTNRVFTEPIPAIRGMETELRTIDGIQHDVIVKGEPTWPFYDIKRAQEEIDTIGISAFNAECQHNVDGDKAGAILPDYDEAVHIITWSAFNAMYRLPPENRNVPQHWRKFCGYDHGSSEGHETAVSWLGVAGMNGPLPGTIFFYKLMSAHAGDISGQMAHRILAYVLAPMLADPATWVDLGLLDRATADIGDLMAAAIRAKITAYLSNHPEYAMFHASHEQKALRDVLRMIYSLPFQACNPKRAGGVEQWKHYMRPDMTEPHPFKPGEMGLCKFYMIVDDDQLIKPVDDAGLAMARAELPEWRWRQPVLTVSGLLDERPQKQYDNVANSIQMILTHFSLTATPLTSAEQVTAAIPPHLRYDELLKNSPFERGLTPEQELSHLFAIQQAKKRAGGRGRIIRFDEATGQRIR